MPAVLIREGAQPATPSEGVRYWSTVATPSLAKIIDDAGVAYTLALLERAQTFTTAQTIAPTLTGVAGLTVNMPASTTSYGVNGFYNSVEAYRILLQAGASAVQFLNRDLGNNIAGPNIFVGRNSNTGAEGGAAGTLRLNDGTSGAARWLWHNAGTLRIHNAAPTGSSGAPTVAETAGVVVGDQTSWHEEKENISPWDNIDEALQAILRTPLFSYQMKSDGRLTSDGNKPTYTGLVVTDEDRRNNAWFATNLGTQQIPTLNERNLFGYLIGAIQAQQRQIEALTQSLAELART